MSIFSFKKKVKVPHLTAAQFFSALCKENPKTNWGMDDILSLNLKWSSKTFTKGTALKAVADAFHLFESQIIPDLDVKLPGSLSSKLKKINHKRILSIAFLKKNLSTPLDIVKSFKTEQDFVKTFLPQTGIPFVNMVPTLKGLFARAKNYASGKKTSKEATKQPSYSPAATLFTELKADNPKVDWKTVSFDSKHLNWKRKSPHADEAIQSVYEAIVRFETNIIPQEIKEKREISIAFLDNGLSSSLDIVDQYTPETFEKAFGPLFGSLGSEWLVEQAYNHALEMRSRILLHYLNIHNTSQSHTRVTPWSPSKNNEKSVQTLPSYHGLFGDDAYREVDPNQSVLSPAAYLYELNKSVKRYILTSQPDLSFSKRRPDIGELMLTPENTSKEVMKLEVVNRVLEQQLKHYFKNSLYKTLSSSFQHMSQPFFLPAEELKGYLELLGTSLDQVWSLCSANEQNSEISSDATLNLPFYEKNDLPTSFDLLSKDFKGSIAVVQLERALQLDYHQMDEIIAGNYTAEEIQKGNLSQLFVNADEKKKPLFVTQEEGEEEKIANLTELRLSKMIKLSKLSKSYPFTIAQLQWICSNVSKIENLSSTDPHFFARAIPYLETIAVLQSQYNLNVDQAVGLLGLANPTTILEDVFPGLLGCKWDSNGKDDKNQQIRNTLIKGIGVGDPGFDLLVSCVIDQFTNNNASCIQKNILILNEELLSALWRVRQLIRISNTSYLDLLILFKLSESEPLLGPSRLKTEVLGRLPILSRFLQAHEWISSNDFSFITLDYLYCGEFSRYFSVYSEATAEPLISQIEGELEKSSVDASSLDTVISSTLDQNSTPQASPRITRQEEDFSGKDLLEILEKNACVNKGLVVKTLSQEEIKTSLLSQGIEISLEGSEDSETILLNLVQKIEENLNTLHKQQNEIFFSSLENNLKIDPSFSNSFSNWGSYVLANSNPLQLLAERKDLTSVLSYLNAIVRFKTLIREFGFDADDVEEIINRPSLFCENPDDAFTPTLPLSSLQELKRISELKQKCSSSCAQLYQSLEQEDLDDLCDHLGIPSKEMKALLKVSQLEKEQKTFSWLERVLQLVELQAQTGLTAKQLQGIASLSSHQKFKEWQKWTSEVERAAQTKYKHSDWRKIIEPLEVELQEKKRDVLTEELLHQFRRDPKSPPIQTRSELSSHLLIDLDVSALVTTSYVKEAITALQLYIHRCEMHIEEGITIDPEFEILWKWMRSYSIWAANRLVFLYPENYLEPELRKGRTPLFDQFSSVLKRNKVNPEQIDNAYNNYLDGFLSIANLEIVNAWVYDKSHNQNKELILIGRTTESDGFKYFYRIASFKFNERLRADVPDDWGVWKEIETKIPTKWITPVSAFGRIYVFWVEVQQYDGDDEDKKNTGWATIKCCFYNFRDKWSVPQTLAERIHVNVNPRTATFKEQQSLHALDISQSNRFIQIVHHFEKNKNKTVLSLDPHMRVKKEENSSFKASFTLSSTNTKTGFIDGSPTYSLKDNKGKTSPYISKEKMTLGGWFYIENTDQCTLAKFTSRNALPNTAKAMLGDSLYTGMSLEVKKGKLFLTDIPSIPVLKPVRQSCDLQHSVKAKQWYYIAFQVDSSQQEKGILQVTVPKLIVMEASYSKQRIVGSVSHLNTRKFVAKYQNRVKFKQSARKGRKTVVSSIALSIQLLFNDSSITCLSGSKGKIKNVSVFDSLVPMDRMIQLSGATTGHVPQVHISSEDFLCNYVPNSDRRMILMQNEQTSYLVTNDARMDKQYFYRLTSSIASVFDNTYSSNVDGISALLSPITQQTREASFEDLGPDPKKVPKEFWPQDHFIDLNGADEVYYWELFFHVPHLLAKTFHVSQNFEQAKKWYEYIFNPLTDTSQTLEKQEDPNDAYWSFLGLRTHNNPTLRYEHFGNEVYELIDDVANDSSTKPKWDIHLPAIKKYHEDPFDPHAIAKLRPIAYQKSVFKNYVNNLIDWGDHLYLQNTRETLSEAYMLYAVVVELLGSKPFNAGSMTLPSPQKLNGLLSTKRELSDFLLGIENSLTQSGPINASPIALPHNEVTGSYFSIPENEAFIELWTRVESRLYNLRHQLTLDGQPNHLPLFQPPADPLALIAQTASGGASGQGEMPGHVAVPTYRFTTIFPKAMEFVSYLIRFGTQLQSFMRTRDVTVLQEMKQGHQMEILKQMEDIKKGSVKMAQNQLESAKLSLSRAEYKRDYFDTLLNEGIGKKSSEFSRYKAAAAMKDTGLVLRELSTILFAVSSDLSFVKMLTAPFSGLVFGMSAGGANVAGGPDGAAKASMHLAFAYQTQAGVLASIASELTQAQNNYFRKKSAQQSVEDAKKRIELYETRLEVTKKNYEIYKTQLRHQQEIEDYYRQSFLDEELYLWMIQQMTALYKQAYSIAYEQLLDCQRAWQYEIGDNTQSFITSCYWNDAYRGFLAGEKMSADLLRMEKEYYKKNTRSLEIVKEYSLSQIDPLALVNLIQTGNCHFSLSQALFDADYPGHYKRRIKSVSLSLITNNKPNNINATLTQMSNQVVMEADLDIVSFLSKGKTTKGSDSLNPQLERKIWRDENNHQQIATSTASDDPGLFSLSFDYDKRYLPFEGTGAVSEWLLEIGMKENPLVCKPVDQALYTHYFLSKLDVTGLVQFLQRIQESPNLMNSFHSEVMELLNKKWEIGAISDFVKQAMEDKELLNDWFQNLGKENLETLSSLLASKGDTVTSASLKACITSNKNLPQTSRDGNASATSVLDIADIVIKISYTSLSGSVAFREDVRNL